MKFLNSDSLRRALNHTASTGGATELVRETLARHGLAGGGLSVPQQPPATGAGRQAYSCAAGSREYVVDVPQGRPVTGLLLMLHGCTQTPEDFAAGTRMTAAAGAEGLVVVWPAQSRGANAQTCWNWFSPGDQRQGRGEPAILSGIVREVMAAHEVPPGRVYVAGLSAGAAMAVILGQTYPDLFAGVGAHSGLAYGSARDVPQAFAAMRGEVSEPRSPTAGHATPTIVFHGSADATVVPANGTRILRNTLDAAAGPQTQSVTSGHTGGRSHTRTVTLAADGSVLAEHWQVEGLGHAWSGGDRAGSYADPAGPDASAEMLRFFLSLNGGAD